MADRNPDWQTVLRHRVPNVSVIRDPSLLGPWEAGLIGQVSAVLKTGQRLCIYKFALKNPTTRTSSRCPTPSLCLHRGGLRVTLLSYRLSSQAKFKRNCAFLWNMLESSELPNQVKETFKSRGKIKRLSSLPSVQPLRRQEGILRLYRITTRFICLLTLWPSARILPCLSL